MIKDFIEEINFMIYNQQDKKMDLSEKINRGAPMSLLGQVSAQSSFSVWFCDQNGRLLEVGLSCGNLTVSQAIREAVDKFNKIHRLSLKDDLTCYQLYGAKKNGKRKSDFPSLEYEQTVQNTKLTKFHLMPLFPMIRKHSEESTITSIKSSMEMTNTSSKKQIKAKKGFGCFFCGPK